MREIQQQKTQKVNNIIAKQSKNTDPSIDQQQSHRKNQTSLALLDRHLPRPSRPTYRGNPQIIVGVIFDPVKPIYLAVVDVITGKTITCRSTRQLLGDKYPQLSEYRFKQQHNNHHRKKKNKQGQFDQPTESTQGEYLDRLLAKAVIQVAQEFNASSIALPPVDTALGKLQTEKNMMAETKQALVPPKLAHSCGFGKIDLVPNAAVGGKLHESNYKVAVLSFAGCEQT